MSVPETPQKILPRSLPYELRQSYLDYAMSVIVGRALPDVRDGLKPVHRRILYAMHENNLTADRKHRKSATVVGDVLGKFHPHGDASVYDAMVRLAQDFNIRYPLVDGHGNFGSLDGDPPAAYRYTEARLSRLASELLVDIDAQTVDFVPNYDGTTEEPTVMPSRIPNLLINGSAGIAVGMATNIPPHNLHEVCEALSALIDSPDLTSGDLMTYIKGPDFPSGGIIMGERGIHEAYATGRGSITLRAVCEVEEVRKDRMAIVATQLPYQVGPDPLLAKIAELVKDKRIDGIADLRNESDRDGIRVVIELKRDAVAQVVLNNLYKLTSLQTSYGIIFLALVGGQPKILPLRDMLVHYLDHRVEVLTRRTAYEKRKAEARLHIVEGLLVCQHNLDEVIALIRGSQNTESARQGLISQFSLTEIQANAILEMQLRRLTQLERGKLEDEAKALQQRIADLEAILADRAKIYALIKQDLQAVRDKFGDARRTQLEHDAGDFRNEDLIPDEPMAVFITDQGYVKRLVVDTFERQGRGGKGITGMGHREGDFVRHFFVGSTHQPVLFFTNKGLAYSLKIYELPEASRTAKGGNIASLLPLSAGEHVTSVVPVPKGFGSEQFLLMLTRLGTIKKTELSAFANIRRSGIIAIALDDGDELGWVAHTAGDSGVIIATQEGMAIHFPEDELRPLGRPARGVRAITLRPGDTVVGMAMAQADADLLTATTDGYGKRTPISEYRPQSRGGLGLINIKLNPERNGRVANILVVRDLDEIALVTTQGIVIRQNVSDIGRYSRMAQGVRLQRLGEDDRVAGVAPLVAMDED